MITHSLCQSRRLALALVCLGSPTLHAGDDPEVYNDPSGDAVIRRTDLGNDGPISGGSLLPDLRTITLGGWVTSTPTTNPYNGNWRDPSSAILMRLDVEFNGLVNPPGPLNLLGEGYDPYRYGPSPLYGFLEFDIDRDPDTGGQIDNVRNHVLGNVSRFGGTISQSVGERAAVTGDDMDGNLLTEPLVERSGEEFQLSFCACFNFSVNTQGDTSPSTFDEGDSWILTGRFFQRIDAFADYSSAFNGSQPGQYDPVVSLRFKHDVGTDRTVISLVYPITNAGSAALKGQSTQPNDFNVANQNSLLECIEEIRFAAQEGSGGPGTDFDLLRMWADGNHSDFADFLDPTRWRLKGIFGTGYSTQQTGALYVWADVGPDFEYGDCNGDGFVNSGDRAMFALALASVDGGQGDADGMVNGQYAIPDFGMNFALFDFGYDGSFNALDFEYISARTKGDINCDGLVDVADQLLLSAMLGFMQGQVQFNPAADVVDDGVIDGADLRWMNKRVRLKRATP